MGFVYDSINRDALLRLTNVKDGRIVLDSGVSYGVLALPPECCLTPEVVNKIRDLIAAGATVVGPRPDRSPSLEQFPAADGEVRQIASMVWQH